MKFCQRLYIDVLPVYKFEIYPSLGFVVRVGWMKCPSKGTPTRLTFKLSPQFSIQGNLGFVSDSTIWNDLGCSATEKALQSAVHLGIFASNLAEADNGFTWQQPGKKTHPKG